MNVDVLKFMRSHKILQNCHSTEVYIFHIPHIYWWLLHSFPLVPKIVLTGSYQYFPEYSVAQNMSGN